MKSNNFEKKNGKTSKFEQSPRTTLNVSFFLLKIFQISGFSCLPVKWKHCIDK